MLYESRRCFERFSVEGLAKFYANVLYASVIPLDLAWDEKNQPALRISWSRNNLLTIMSVLSLHEVQFHYLQSMPIIRLIFLSFQPE